MNTHSVSIFILILSPNLIYVSFTCVPWKHLHFSICHDFLFLLCVTLLDYQELLKSSVLPFFFDFVFPLPVTISEIYTRHSPNIFRYTPWVTRRADQVNQSPLKARWKYRQFPIETCIQNIFYGSNSALGRNQLDGEGPVFPLLAFILTYCYPKCFLDETSVAYTVGWLIPLPSHLLLVENSGKLKNHFTDCWRLICQLCTFTQDR